MVEFKIMRKQRKLISRIMTLDSEAQTLACSGNSQATSLGILL